MRITLIGPLPPPHGGIASHVDRMKDHLLAQGHSVHVVSPYASSRPGFVKTHITRLPFVLLRKRHRHLRHWHLTGWHRLLLMGCCERILPGKSLYTLHVDLDRVGPSDPLLRWILRPLDTVVCVKEADAQQMEARHLHRHVKLIPAFVKARRPAEPEPELCAWLRSRKAALLFMASHWGTTNGEPAYGLDLLLSALAPLARECPDMGLLALVPSEPMPEDQRRHVASSLEELGKCVRLVDRPVDLQAVLPAADVFVRPTRTDGDALSLREAAILGVPIVASDCVPRLLSCRLFRSGSAEELRLALRPLLRDRTTLTHSPDQGIVDYAQPLVDEYQRLVDGA